MKRNGHICNLAIRGVVTKCFQRIVQIDVLLFGKDMCDVFNDARHTVAVSGQKIGMAGARFILGRLKLLGKIFSSFCEVLCQRNGACKRTEASIHSLCARLHHRHARAKLEPGKKKIKRGGASPIFGNLQVWNVDRWYFLIYETPSGISVGAMSFSDLNGSDTEEEEWSPPLAPPLACPPPPPPPSIMSAADPFVCASEEEEGEARGRVISRRSVERQKLEDLLRSAGCICPIGLCPMVNPVLLASGHTYELEIIDEFFRSLALEQHCAQPTAGITYFCPMTKQTLDPDCRMLAKCPCERNPNKRRRCVHKALQKCICCMSEGVLEWDDPDFAPCRPLMIPNLGVKQACEAIVTNEGHSLEFLHHRP